jgi:hypothetical protein
MAYEEIKEERDIEYVKIKGSEPGRVLIDAKFVERVDGGKYGPSWKFEGDSPGKFKVISSKNLNSRLEKVAPGAKVRITFEGTKTVMSGQWKGSQTYVFKVNVDNSEVVF